MWFWYPRDGVCVVSDRFLSVLWDTSRNSAGLPFRLHCDNGPAVSFRDGWGLYYWHGYRIPTSHEWIIRDRNQITAEKIMAEPNAELRRIMCEITEWKPLLERAVVLDADQDGNGHPRRLLEKPVGNDRHRVIHVVNGSLEPDGSRREFVLGAMSGARTAHEAVAMSYGINPQHYREWFGPERIGYAHDLHHPDFRR